MTPDGRMEDLASQETLLSSIFRGYGFWVVVLILANTALGTSVSLILRYFDNVVKGFGFTLIIFAVTMFSWMFLGIEVNACFFCALVIYTCSSYLYVADFNDVLKKHDENTAAIGSGERSALVGGEAIGKKGGSSREGDIELGTPGEEDARA